MSSTGSRLAYVCLRCRKDLVRRILPLSRCTRASPSTFQSQRHQSTVAAELFDNSWDEDEPPQDAAETLRKSPDRFKLTRSIRGPRTAGLGVDTLGKPSNIILLPHRDRYIPESMTADDVSKQHLSEALEEENNPVPWEQVREHIDQARATISKESGLLDTTEWHSLRATLKRKFTRNQLERYMREKLGEEAVREMFEGMIRPNVTARVATEVWGYELPDMLAMEPGVRIQKNLATSKTRRISKMLPAFRDDMLLLQQDPSNGIAKIAKETNTSINFVLNQGIEIIGTPRDVTLARRKIYRLKTVVSEISLAEFGGFTFSKEGREAFSTLLGSFRTKALAVVRHKGDSVVTMRHFGTDSGALIRVRAELRFALERLAQSQQPSYNGAINAVRVNLTPYYFSTQRLWSTDGQGWVRAVDSSTNTSDTSKESKSPALSNIATVWKGLRKVLNQPMLEEARGTANGRRMEMVARIGMNIFSTTPTVKAVASKSSGPKSWLVDEVPLIAQLLASKDLRNETPDAKHDDLPIHLPLLVRVLLKPANAKMTTAPSIEIYLSGAEKSLGMSQPLNVRRVTAVLEDKILNTSLPFLPVDLGWSRHIKQDLFVHQSPETSVQPSLLQQINNYLTESRKENNQPPEFAPFRRFEIADELFAQADSDTADSATAEDQKASQEVEYALVAAETVDARHFALPPASEATAAGKANSSNKKTRKKKAAKTPQAVQPLVRYTTFTDQMNLGSRSNTASASSTGERHELSIVECPLLAAPNTVPPTPESYWQASMWVAERIAELSKALNIR